MSTDASDGTGAQHPPTDRDYEALAERSAQFIRDRVAEAGADGVVVALSGGVDSTTTATLAVEALGRERVYGLVMPTDASSDTNIADARDVVWNLEINFRTVDLQPLLEKFVGEMAKKYELRRRPGEASSIRTFDLAPPAAVEDRATAKGNAAARLRMTAAYYEANTTDRLVCGTGNRTELLLGYFTKYGDGGADLLPLGDLYKTEVRELARALGVPERIVQKPPTAGLLEGQTDAGELGATYDTIDAVLRRLVDEGESVERAAEALGVDRDTVARFAEMHANAAHKRAPPPTPADAA